jgi:hypothetical protein
LRDLVCQGVHGQQPALQWSSDTCKAKIKFLDRTNVNASNVKSLTKLCLLEEREQQLLCGCIQVGTELGEGKSSPGPTSWRSSGQLSRHRTRMGQLVFKEDLSVSDGDIVGGNASLHDEPVFK